jgi:hypothetical protein
MTPKFGYKGPQLPPLPLARNIRRTPQSTGQYDTNSKLAAQQIARNNAMKLARSTDKNQVMQQAMGSTPQFSPEAKKVIQSKIDPTGANVGRQAVPMPRAPMMKKGGTTKLHSIKKSNKKSNW